MCRVIIIIILWPNNVWDLRGEGTEDFDVELNNFPFIPMCCKTFRTGVDGHYCYTAFAK